MSRDSPCGFGSESEGSCRGVPRAVGKARATLQGHSLHEPGVARALRPVFQSHGVRIGRATSEPCRESGLDNGLLRERLDVFEGSLHGDPA